MKGRLASGLLVTSFAFIAGCGGSGTSSSGTFNCNGGSVNLGPGLTCDDTTNPPTIKIQYGTAAGTVAQGNDSRFSGGGKFLGTFTPTIAQSAPPSLSSPGGFITAGMGNAQTSHNGGGLIYNAATGRIGVRAADEICATIVNWPGQTAAIPTAHACSNEELIRNTHAGNIPEGASGLAYGLFTSGYTPSTDTNAIDSFKATCGDWTYDSADIYQATTWHVESSDAKQITSSPNLATSIRFVAGKSCGGAGPVAYPIACCD